MVDPLAAQFDVEGQRAAALSEKKAQMRQPPANQTAPPQAAAQKRQAMLLKRNLANDRADRYILMSVAGAVTAILAFLWFNLKLFWGQLATKGNSRYIAPPSWRFLKVPILPDFTASAAILVIDLLVLTVLFIMYSFFFMFLGLIGIALTSYVAALKILFGEFSSLISTLIS